MHTYVLWHSVLQSAVSQLEPGIKSVRHRVQGTEVNLCLVLVYFSGTCIVLFPGLPFALYWSRRAQGLSTFITENKVEWVLWSQPYKIWIIGCKIDACSWACAHANVIHIIATLRPSSLLATPLIVCVIVSEQEKSGDTAMTPTHLCFCLGLARGLHCCGHCLQLQENLAGLLCFLGGRGNADKNCVFVL